MADFCKACTEDLFGRDLEHPINFGIKKDEYVVILCEGCGRNVRVNNDGEVLECSTCVFAGDGVCDNHEGHWDGEISTHFVCEKWEKRQ